MDMAATRHMTPWILIWSELWGVIQTGPDFQVAGIFLKDEWKNAFAPGGLTWSASSTVSILEAFSEMKSTLPSSWDLQRPASLGNISTWVLDMASIGHVCSFLVSPNIASGGRPILFRWCHGTSRRIAHLHWNSVSTCFCWFSCRICTFACFSFPAEYPALLLKTRCSL